MSKRLEVLPGVGIGAIRFGMHPGDVSALMDEPITHEAWMGGNLNDALLYHGVRFHFDKFDAQGPLPSGRLNEIVICGREDAFLIDRPLFDWRRSELAEHLRSLGMNPVLLGNGDVETVEPYLAMSFDAEDRVVWLEMGRAFISAP